MMPNVSYIIGVELDLLTVTQKVLEYAAKYIIITLLWHCTMTVPFTLKLCNPPEICTNSKNRSYYKATCVRGMLNANIGGRWCITGAQ